MPTCDFCGGDTIEVKDQVIHERSGRLIIVKDVPQIFCLQCHKVEFSPDVMEKLKKYWSDEFEYSKTSVISADVYKFR